jgi:hypothetical protein
MPLPAKQSKALPSAKYVSSLALRIASSPSLVPRMVNEMVFLKWTTCLGAPRTFKVSKPVKTCV